MSVARQLRNLRKWWRQPTRWGVRSTDVVLDVGCGNWPNMRANILADKFLLDESERPHPLVIDERPFVVCDARYLPFRDRSADFAVCSHLAEHLEDVERLLSELSRVANAGYIECPSRIREILHGWAFHRWYVTVQGAMLLFEEKPRSLHDAELHRWFTELFENDGEFERFFADNMERFGLVAALTWHGRIDCEVRRLSGVESAWKRSAAELKSRGPVTREELVAELQSRARPRFTRNERIKQRLARLRRRQSQPRADERLRSMLCCPVCRGDLLDRSEGLACTTCGADFPVVENVYYLVPEQVPAFRQRSPDAHSLDQRLPAAGERAVG